MYESELVGTDWLWFWPGGIQGPQKKGASCSGRLRVKLGSHRERPLDCRCDIRLVALHYLV